MFYNGDWKEARVKYLDPRLNTVTADVEGEIEGPESAKLSEESDFVETKEGTVYSVAYQKHVPFMALQLGTMHQLCIYPYNPVIVHSKYTNVTLPTNTPD